MRGKRKRIKHNRIKYLICGDIIESKTVHNFAYCSCKSCFVDGGRCYVSFGAEKLKNIVIMTEFEDESEQ